MVNIGTSVDLAESLRAGEPVKDIAVAQESLDYLRQHGRYRDENDMTVELIENNGRTIVKCGGQAWQVLFSEIYADGSFVARWVD